MSSQAFKAQMAVGSWAKTPLYPGFIDVMKVVESRMTGSEGELEMEYI